MDLESIARIRHALRAFHREFAPDFRRKQWRQRSRDYLHALLVQTEERCNAENLSEVVPTSARVLQRFLTEASWEDAAVTAHLQRYLGPRLEHPDAVWAVDESGLPKQGKKSVGVSRQYCGALGKVANCQVGVFLAHVGPRGRAIVDKRLYLPEEWTTDPARCQAAAVPQEACSYQSKAELALGLLRRAQQISGLHAEWVTGDDEYGKSPAFRDGVAAAGWLYMLEVPSNTPVWPLPLAGQTVSCGQRQEVRERATALPAQAWQPFTVAEGEQGPRTYRFAFERRRDSRDGQPGVQVGVVYRQNLDGSEPRYYFTNAPANTPLQTQARVACARWPIETEIKANKSQVGLDEYEVRSWTGWNHHITLCLLASAFLLSLQQEWGEKAAPSDAPAGLPGGVRSVAAQALDCGRLAALACGHPGSQ